MRRFGDIIHGCFQKRLQSDRIPVGGFRKNEDTEGERLKMPKKSRSLILLGGSIQFSLWCMLLLSQSPLHDAKPTKMCNLLPRRTVKPGMACECGEDFRNGLCFVTKRFAYNMSCIDCPPRSFFDDRDYDCRHCPTRFYNCHKAKHLRTYCKPCEDDTTSSTAAASPEVNEMTASEADTTSIVINSKTEPSSSDVKIFTTPTTIQDSPETTEAMYGPSEPTPTLEYGTIKSLTKNKGANDSELNNLDFSHLITVIVVLIVTSLLLICICTCFCIYIRRNRKIKAESKTSMDENLCLNSEIEETSRVIDN